MTHRDAHMWNFLYHLEYKDGIRLIDWERYAIDIPVIDIAYYITVYWTKERRDKYEKKLLKYFYEMLNNFREKSYSYQDFIDDYKISMISLIYIYPHKEIIGIENSSWYPEFENLMMTLDEWDRKEVALEFLK